VHAARQVDGDDRGAVSGGILVRSVEAQKLEDARDRLPGSTPQRGGITADAEDAVDDHGAARHRSIEVVAQGDQRGTRCARGRSSLLVNAVAGREHRHSCAPVGKLGRREQRVTPVVTRTGEHEDARRTASPRAVAEQVAHVLGKGRGRTTHERLARGQERRFGGPHLVGRPSGQVLGEGFGGHAGERTPLDPLTAGASPRKAGAMPDTTAQKKPTSSIVDHLADSVGKLGIGASYGDPITIGGTDITPVALVWYGFGAGQDGAGDAPSGGGGGGASIPIGVYAPGPDGPAFKPNLIALLAVSIPVLWVGTRGLARVVKALKK